VGRFGGGSIGVARGAVGAPAPPRAVKKIRRNLQEKFVSAPPAHQVLPKQRTNQFFGYFCWAGRFGGLASTLLRKKVHP